MNNNFLSQATICWLRYQMLTSTRIVDFIPSIDNERELLINGYS